MFADLSSVLPWITGNGINSASDAMILVALPYLTAHFLFGQLPYKVSNESLHKAEGLLWGN